MFQCQYAVSRLNVVFQSLCAVSRRSVVFQGLYAMSMNCMEAAEAQFSTAVAVSHLWCRWWGTVVHMSINFSSVFPQKYANKF